MAEYRLKIKIGDHEFEADGPAEAVTRQFEAFKELIATLPNRKSENTIVTQNPSNQTQIENLDRIFREQGRVISLTAPPNSESDAILLVLYGQRHYRKNENPTGSEIVDGMEQSGYRMVRIDKILKSLADEGAVIITGTHRGKRYRLTNAGLKRAEAVVRDALAKLP
jgi:hypothetical protein